MIVINNHLYLDQNFIMIKDTNKSYFFIYLTIPFDKNHS